MYLSRYLQVMLSWALLSYLTKFILPYLVLKTQLFNCLISGLFVDTKWHYYIGYSLRDDGTICYINSPTLNHNNNVAIKYIYYLMLMELKHPWLIGRLFIGVPMAQHFIYCSKIYWKNNGMIEYLSHLVLEYDI